MPSDYFSQTGKNAVREAVKPYKKKPSPPPKKAPKPKKSPTAREATAANKAAHAATVARATAAGQTAKGTPYHLRQLKNDPAFTSKSGVKDPRNAKRSLAPKKSKKGKR